ncbi:hypothetical protein [Aquabacterium sp.]|uniref:hypothetical protein n=1 Tax=Aquabacterium sp. TaxID=1872578 RepID=UPI004037AD06
MTEAKQLSAEEFLKLMADNDDEPDGVSCVYEDDWTQDYKYQVRANVYRVDATGQCFQVCESRSGSYHTDWYYNDPDCFEVWPVTETKTVTVTNYVTEKPEVVRG